MFVDILGNQDCSKMSIRCMYVLLPGYSLGGGGNKLRDSWLIGNTGL